MVVILFLSFLFFALFSAVGLGIYIEEIVFVNGLFKLLKEIYCKELGTDSKSANSFYPHFLSVSHRVQKIGRFITDSVLIASIPTPDTRCSMSLLKLGRIPEMTR